MNYNTGNIVDFVRSQSIDFTKDGECSGCGSCCSNILPMTQEEVNRITTWVKKNNYKPHRCNFPFAKPTEDLTCPFRNEETHKCDIYEIRPLICRDYRCDRFIRGDKPVAISGARPVLVRQEVFGID